MKVSIEKAAQRKRLKVRHEPHWQSAGDRCAVGYRREDAAHWEDGTGHWIARWREPNGPKKHFEPLKGARSFDDALKAAMEWFKKISAGNTRKVIRGTVSAALAEYVADLRKQNRIAAAKEIEARFKLTVGEKPFSRMKLEAVTKTDFRKWREGLDEGREPRSVNRQVRAVKAALNFAVGELEWAGNPEAWALKHLADDDEEHSAVFLTPVQRAQLIKHAGDATALFTGFSHLGCRPKELEATLVEDFDPVGCTVRLVHRKGKGGKVRERKTPLDKAGIEFFKTMIKDKLPKTPLVTNTVKRRDGKGYDVVAWNKSHRCRAMRDAIEAANEAAETPEQRIPEGASAYSFRHSRISELLQVHKIDALKVAKMTGTSVAMIERAYWKYIPDAMLELLNEAKTA
jgi:integrase